MAHFIEGDKCKSDDSVDSNFRSSEGSDFDSNLSASSSPRTKQLRFHNLVRVILVPSITEYREAGLMLSLWSSKEELQVYRDCAQVEVHQFMLDSNCASFSTALKLCFQPDHGPNADGTGVLPHVPEDRV